MYTTTINYVHALKTCKPVCVPSAWAFLRTTLLFKISLSSRATQIIDVFSVTWFNFYIIWYVLFLALLNLCAFLKRKLHDILIHRLSQQTFSKYVGSNFQLRQAFWFFQSLTHNRFINSGSYTIFTFYLYPMSDDENMQFLLPGCVYCVVTSLHTLLYNLVQPYSVTFRWIYLRPHIWLCKYIFDNFISIFICLYIRLSSLRNRTATLK